jgi:type 1 glutamine amidotransferase
MKKALIVYGGWDGHEPKPCAEIFAKALTANGFKVEVSDTLMALADEKKVMGLDLIVPLWTMGELPGEAAGPLFKAVQAGVGLAGCHGGMGDAFRSNTAYQMMVGGQFVDHPFGYIDYRVDIVDHCDPITAGLESFAFKSEQYYMHVDPSNEVLATTTAVWNGATMPCIWKRPYGKGRVFYSALGHCAKEFIEYPIVLEILTRGMLWAAEGKPTAPAKGKKK